jgi:ATP-dependent Clp protease ATP-binding subunit ClpA
MNEQHIEEIINTLYDLIQDAKNVPLSADKCMLERDKALDMLDEIIARLPSELKQSRAIVESRNEIVGQARREAESIIRQAQEEAKKMVTQEAVYQEAKRQCQEMVLQTQVRLAELRKASNEYMDDALRRTEETIAASLGQVQDTRAKFRALAEAQEKKSAASANNTEA